MYIIYNKCVIKILKLRQDTIAEPLLQILNGLLDYLKTGKRLLMMIGKAQTTLTPLA